MDCLHCRTSVTAEALLHHGERLAEGAECVAVVGAHGELAVDEEQQGLLDRVHPPDRGPGPRRRGTPGPRGLRRLRRRGGGGARGRCGRDGRVHLARPTPRVRKPRAHRPSRSSKQLLQLPPAV